MKNPSDYKHGIPPFDLIVWVKANEAEIRRLKTNDELASWIMDEKQRLGFKYMWCIHFTEWYLDLL